MRAVVAVLPVGSMLLPPALEGRSSCLAGLSVGSSGSGQAFPIQIGNSITCRVGAAAHRSQASVSPSDSTGPQREDDSRPAFVTAAGQIPSLAWMREGRHMGEGTPERPTAFHQWMASSLWGMTHHMFAPHAVVDDVCQGPDRRRRTGLVA